MQDIFLELNRSVNAFVWGLPAMVAIIGVGLWLTCRTHVVQVDLGAIWEVADTFNGLMAVPNLVALFLLSGKLIEIMRERQTNENAPA